VSLGATRPRPEWVPTCRALHLVQVPGRKYPQKLALVCWVVFVGWMKLSPIEILLTESERQELERRARSLTAPHREVVRAKVILGLAGGKPLMRLESELQLTRKIVRKWGTRFERHRLEGPQDRPRSGRPVRFSPRSSGTSGEARLRVA
jgi:hypothetical protein